MTRETVTTWLDLAGIVLLVASVGVLVGALCLWAGLAAAGFLTLVASALVELRRPRTRSTEETA